MYYVIKMLFPVHFYWYYQIYAMVSNGWLTAVFALDNIRFFSISSVRSENLNSRIVSMHIKGISNLKIGLNKTHILVNDTELLEIDLSDVFGQKT